MTQALGIENRNVTPGSCFNIDIVLGIHYLGHLVYDCGPALNSSNVQRDNQPISRLNMMTTNVFQAYAPIVTSFLPILAPKVY